MRILVVSVHEPFFSEHSSKGPSGPLVFVKNTILHVVDTNFSTDAAMPLDGRVR